MSLSFSSTVTLSVDETSSLGSTVEGATVGEATAVLLWKRMKKNAAAAMAAQVVLRRGEARGARVWKGEGLGFRGFW